MPCGFFAGIPFMQEGERNARWPIPHTMLHDRLTELVCHDGSRGALVQGNRHGKTEWNPERENAIREFLKGLKRLRILIYQ